MERENMVYALIFIIEVGVEASRRNEQPGNKYDPNLEIQEIIQNGQRN